MESFAAIIDKIGVGTLAAAFGVEESHIRTMKTRDSIPPEYWPQLIELAPTNDLPRLDWPSLSQLRRDRFKAADEPASAPEPTGAAA